MQRRIAGEIHAHAIRFDRPAAPERVAAVADPARAEVLRGRRSRAKHRRLNGLPPIALDEMSDAERAKERPESQWTKPGGLGKSLREAPNGRRVEMVVVV